VQKSPPIKDAAKNDVSDVTASTISPLTRVTCEVVTAKTLERPMSDVEPLCTEQSSSKIAQTSAYTVQNVLCSNSGENPTIFHPLERRTTTAERASDAESERGHPVHLSLALPLPQTDCDVIRLPPDRTSTLQTHATTVGERGLLSTLPPLTGHYAACIVQSGSLPPSDSSLDQLTGYTTHSTTSTRATTTVASTTVHGVPTAPTSSGAARSLQPTVALTGHRQDAVQAPIVPGRGVSAVQAAPSLPRGNLSTVEPVCNPVPTLPLYMLSTDDDSDSSVSLPATQPGRPSRTASRQSKSTIAMQTDAIDLANQLAGSLQHQLQEATHREERAAAEAANREQRAAADARASTAAR